MIHHYLIVALIAVHGVPAPGGGAPLAATPQPTAAAQKPAAQKPQPFTASVTSKDGFIDVALTAEGISLAEIAADLSTRLRARIIVGPSVRTETISVNIPATPLEQALTSLAPRVFVDYEIRQDAPPAPRDIYLLGPSDAEPPLNTDARGMSQGLLVEGHTEDTPAKPEDDPLKVMGDQNILTITSKKQPLSLVLMAIGDVLGVPVDAGGAATELVDADIRNARPEDAISRLSPNIRVHVRVDVNRSERKLIRVAAASSAAAR
jgi:hypothetical protein